MDLEYRLDGPNNAPVLVLSNSLGTTWSMWDNQFSNLIQHFRVLRYNTRGHGNSPLPVEELSLATLGNDVIALLDHLNIGQASFCGLSLGGMTGMWLNLHAPKRFTRFVVANTAAKIGDAQAWRDRAALVKREGMGTVAASSSGRWFTQQFIDARPGVVESLMAGIAAIPPEGYAACCLALADADLRPHLTDMQRPMLVIAGEQDPVTTPKDAETIANTAHNAQWISLPASHLSNVACPTQFSRQVLHYLTTGGIYGLNN